MNEFQRLELIAHLKGAREIIQHFLDETGYSNLIYIRDEIDKVLGELKLGGKMSEKEFIENLEDIFRRASNEGDGDVVSEIIPYLKDKYSIEIDPSVTDGGCNYHFLKKMVIDQPTGKINTYGNVGECKI